MPTTVLRPATEAQLAFLNNLRRERNLPTETWREFSARNWSTRDASREIDALKATPRANARPAAEGAPDVSDLPPSKYLVHGDRGQSVHVEIVERRNGRRYLNLLLGAPGDWRRERVSYATVRSLADKVRNATYTDAGRVLHGPEAAAVRFSREYTVCACCLSPLSDDESKRLGLGPVCRSRFAF